MEYPNYPDKYYWKNKEGGPGIYPGDLLAAKTGYWQRYLTFEQKRDIAMKNDRSLDYAGVGMLAATFAIMGSIEGGAFVWGSVENPALDAVAQTLFKYCHYVPVAGEIGRYLRRKWDVGIVKCRIK